MSFRSTRILAALGAAALLAAPAVALQATPAKAMPSAQELLERAEKAAGFDKSRSFESRRIKQTMVMAAAGMSMEITTTLTKDGKMLVETSMQGMTLKQGFDGETAWAVDPMQGPRLLSPEETEQMKNSPEMTGMLEAYPEAEVLGEEAFEGRPAWKLKLKSKLGQETTAFIDQENDRLLGMSGVQASPMGEVPFVAVMGEYADHHGMRIPGTMTMKAMGMEQVITLKSVEVNLATLPSFAPPPEVAALKK